MTEPTWSLDTSDMRMSRVVAGDAGKESEIVVSMRVTDEGMFEVIRETFFYNVDGGGNRTLEDRDPLSNPEREAVVRYVTPERLTRIAIDRVYFKTFLENALVMQFDEIIQQLDVGGPRGDGAAAYGVTGGGLPPGVNLDAVTGALTGTASKPGVFDFEVSAMKAVGDDPSLWERMAYQIGVADRVEQIEYATQTDGVAAVALTADGDVWVIADGTSGTLAGATTQPRQVVFPSGSGARARIAAAGVDGVAAAFAMSASGAIHGWGALKVLGVGATSGYAENPVAVQIPGGDTVADLVGYAVGGQKMWWAALGASGAVYVWGDGIFGGSSGGGATPVSLGLAGVKAIAPTFAAAGGGGGALLVRASDETVKVTGSMAGTSFSTMTTLLQTQAPGGAQVFACGFRSALAESYLYDTGAGTYVRAAALDNQTVVAAGRDCVLLRNASNVPSRAPLVATEAADIEIPVASYTTSPTNGGSGNPFVKETNVTTWQDAYLSASYLGNKTPELLPGVYGPHIITTLASSTRVETVRFHNRAQSGMNYTPSTVEIYGSHDGTNWKYQTTLAGIKDDFGFKEFPIETDDRYNRMLFVITGAWYMEHTFVSNLEFRRSGGVAPVAVDAPIRRYLTRGAVLSDSPRADAYDAAGDLVRFAWSSFEPQVRADPVDTVPATALVSPAALATADVTQIIVPNEDGWQDDGCRAYYLYLMADGSAYTYRDDRVFDAHRNTEPVLLSGLPWHLARFSSTRVPIDEKVVAIAAPSEIARFALGESGKVYAWGRRRSIGMGVGDDIMGLTTVTQFVNDPVALIRCENRASVFVTVAGEVWATSAIAYRFIFNVDSGYTPVRAVAGGVPITGAVDARPGANASNMLILCDTGDLYIGGSYQSESATSAYTWQTVSGVGYIFNGMYRLLNGQSFQEESNTTFVSRPALDGKVMLGACYGLLIYKDGADVVGQNRDGTTLIATNVNAVTSFNLNSLYGENRGVPVRVADGSILLVQDQLYSTTKRVPHPIQTHLQNKLAVANGCVVGTVERRDVEGGGIRIMSWRDFCFGSWPAMNDMHTRMGSETVNPQMSVETAWYRCDRDAVEILDQIPQRRGFDLPVAVCPGDRLDITYRCLSRMNDPHATSAKLAFFDAVDAEQSVTSPVTVDVAFTFDAKFQYMVVNIVLDVERSGPYVAARVDVLSDAGVLIKRERYRFKTCMRHLKSFIFVSYTPNGNAWTSSISYTRYDIVNFGAMYVPAPLPNAPSEPTCCRVDVSDPYDPRESPLVNLTATAELSDAYTTRSEWSFSDASFPIPPEYEGVPVTRSTNARRIEVWAQDAVEVRVLAAATWTVPVSEGAGWTPVASGVPVEFGSVGDMTPLRVRFTKVLGPGRHVLPAGTAFYAFFPPREGMAVVPFLPRSYQTVNAVPDNQNTPTASFDVETTVGDMETAFSRYHLTCRHARMDAVTVFEEGVHYENVGWQGRVRKNRWSPDILEDVYRYVHGGQAETTLTHSIDRELAYRLTFYIYAFQGESNEYFTLRINEKVAVWVNDKNNQLFLATSLGIRASFVRTWTDQYTFVVDIPARFSDTDTLAFRFMTSLNEARDNEYIRFEDVALVAFRPEGAYISHPPTYAFTHDGAYAGSNEFAGDPGETVTVHVNPDAYPAGNAVYEVSFVNTLYETYEYKLYVSTSTSGGEWVLARHFDIEDTPDTYAPQTSTRRHVARFWSFPPARVAVHIMRARGRVSMGNFKVSRSEETGIAWADPNGIGRIAGMGSFLPPGTLYIQSSGTPNPSYDHGGRLFSGTVSDPMYYHSAVNSSQATFDLMFTDPRRVRWVRVNARHSSDAHLPGRLTLWVSDDFATWVSVPVDRSTQGDSVIVQQYQWVQHANYPRRHLARKESAVDFRVDPGRAYRGYRLQFNSGVNYAIIGEVELYDKDSGGDAVFRRIMGGGAVASYANEVNEEGGHLDPDLNHRAVFSNTNGHNGSPVLGYFHSSANSLSHRHRYELNRFVRPSAIRLWRRPGNDQPPGRIRVEGYDPSDATWTQILDTSESIRPLTYDSSISVEDIWQITDCYSEYPLAVSDRYYNQVRISYTDSLSTYLIFGAAVLYTGTPMFRQPTVPAIGGALGVPQGWAVTTQSGTNPAPIFDGTNSTFVSGTGTEVVTVTCASATELKTVRLYADNTPVISTITVQAGDGASFDTALEKPVYQGWSNWGDSGTYDTKGYIHFHLATRIPCTQYRITLTSTAGDVRLRGLIMYAAT